MTDPLSALRNALTPHGFGVWLDPVAIRLLLEHTAQLEARIAGLTIERDQALDSCDRARNALAGLVEQPPPEDR